MRKELRYLSGALVYVTGENTRKIKANLRDLSPSGLSIRSEEFIDIEPGSSYVIAIIPEEQANIREFQLEIEARWVRINRFRMESGFSVLRSIDGAEFGEYLDYLARRGKPSENGAAPFSK